MLYRAYVASEEIPRTCDFAALEFGASGCKFAILPNKPGGISVEYSSDVISKGVGVCQKLYHCAIIMTY